MEITKYTVIYGVYIRFWPTLCMYDLMCACVTLPTALVLPVPVQSYQLHPSDLCLCDLTCVCMTISPVRVWPSHLCLCDHLTCACVTISPAATIPSRFLLCLLLSLAQSSERSPKCAQPYVAGIV